MNKKYILILPVLITVFACNSKDDRSKNLSDYLNFHNLNIKNYNVICFVPVDGCGSCIDPTLNYTKDADKSFLLILTSIGKKSISYTIERAQLKDVPLILDSTNLAVKNELTTDFAPCYYFIKNGTLVKKVDLNLLHDKSSILKEVDDFLKQTEN
jgi:hypothetical protein